MTEPLSCQSGVTPTSSHCITQVKQRRARLTPGWVTGDEQVIEVKSGKVSSACLTEWCKGLAW